MSLTRLPAELRRRAACQPTYTLAHLQQQRRQASILFALSALSNSRETQHFNKATKLSRVEHSPALKLIQTSEVDPFKAVGPVKREVSGVSEGTVKEGELKQTTLPSNDGTAAVLISPSDVAAPPSSSDGNGDDKKPPIDAESAAEQERDIDNKEALKIGRAFLGEHVRDKRKLRQELREARAELEKMQASRDRARDRLKQYKADAAEVESSNSGFYLVLTLFALLTGATVGYLYGPGQQTASIPEQLENKRNASKAKQLEATEKGLKELKSQDAQKSKEVVALKALMEAEGKVLMDYHEKNKAYEAKMADWTKKAEELKRAVERKDVRSLSKAEQNAYLEALVFLGVKDKPERRWWKGLFWSQE